MGECRGGDCLIKLFGKTIPVPESGAGTGDVEKDLQHSGSTTIESKVQANAQQDSTDTAPQPEGADTDDSPAAKNSSTDEEQAGDTGNQKEKLKKPDKILPCPRCSSMDTKFCYYNNYNINQPRHFCKNCQRYWTAGGAMRNVPVGAGRRKSKSAAAASHFLQRVRAALPGDPLCPPIKTNGTVLSFGSDTAALDLAEQMAHLREKIIPICRSWNADDPSIGSCAEGSNNGEDKNQMGIKEKVTVEKPAKAVQHPCMNGGAMWPYGCAPSPAYYTSSIAIPFYPAAAYWGCMVPGAWGVSVAPQSQSQAALSPNAASSVSSGPNSLTLGKHPRDDGKEGNNGNCNGNGKVWAPKTVRINDVDEVARSSIWTLIGIKGDKASTCTHGRKLARVFEPKGEAKTAAGAVINSSPLLHANPVALSRSVTFQEGC